VTSRELSAEPTIELHPQATVTETALSIPAKFLVMKINESCSEMVRYLVPLEVPYET
jgi:hypothetical protein